MGTQSPPDGHSEFPIVETHDVPTQRRLAASLCSTLQRLLQRPHTAVNGSVPHGLAEWCAEYPL